MRKIKIPVPPHPLPLEPKKPGTLRTTYWAEGDRILCWTEINDHEGVLTFIDRLDEDRSPSGEKLSSMAYDWGPVVQTRRRPGGPAKPSAIEAWQNRDADPVGAHEDGRV